ncbi:MAG: hypothetical protein KY467_01120 [Gemmatimonadetes bacterium]|nr:hypothetical protein [Gemmatimonadota bacterium]
MRNLLALLRTPRGRAACDRWGWPIDAQAAAYERERANCQRAVSSARIDNTRVPLSRGALAWARGDIDTLGVS